MIEEKALIILRSYIGSNNYIQWLRKQLESSKLVITKIQAKYVVDNENTIPNTVDKYVPIQLFPANSFQKYYKLPEPPTHVYINKILTRKGDDLHIWGAFEEKPSYYISIYINKRDFKVVKTIEDLDFSNFSREPKPHQIIAVTTLLKNDKFILADDMGLGKTMSAIMAAVLGKFKKILVVCPASLKYNWRVEIGYCDDINDVTIIDSNNYSTSKWTIINYDILKNHHHLPGKDENGVLLPTSNLELSQFDLIIGDESHYVKSSTSTRTKLFKHLSTKIGTKWLLTGTPIANKPIDFFSLLEICDSPLAQNWQAFVIRYCKGFQIKNKSTGKSFWKMNGASNMDELKRFTADIILRRTKKELDLPNKTTKSIIYPIGISTLYNQYMDEYDHWVDDMKDQEIEMPMTAHLTKLIAVRQLLSKDKIPTTISLIEDFIEEGHKVVVFSCFTETIRTIHDHFKKAAVLIDGSVSAQKRHSAVESFQNDDKVKVMCGNIIAAGVGLTLTTGTIVIFNDLDWVPANHAQATDRIFRIGQTKDVHIIYQLVADTIDMTMFESLQAKISVINEILGDDVADDISVSTAVIKELKNKKKKPLKR